MSWGLSAAIGIPLVVGVLAVVWPERVARGKSLDDIGAWRRGSIGTAERKDEA